MTDLEAIEQLAALIHHGAVALDLTEAEAMITLEAEHLSDRLLEQDPHDAAVDLSCMLGHALNLAVFTAARAAQLAGLDEHTGPKYVAQLLTDVISAMRRSAEAQDGDA